MLTIRTDRGDLILDNLNEKMLVWSETPYTYYKAPIPGRDPNVWVMLDPIPAR